MYQLGWFGWNIKDLSRYVLSLYAGPVGVMRVNKTPVNAGPYTIPSGHILLPCMNEIMMGEESWINASKFDPTRFMEAGKYKRDERVIPFQIGKRVCPGEGLAKAELFLFLVGLIQKFKFEPETPGTIVDYTMKPGFTCIPQRHDQIKVTRIVWDMKIRDTHGNIWLTYTYMK